MTDTTKYLRHTRACVASGDTATVALMDRFALTMTPLAFLACTGCPLPDPGTTTSDGDEAADATGTGEPLPDLPAETSTESGGDGDGDGDGDAGDGDGDGTSGDGDGDGEPLPMRWAAMDVNDKFIGWLASPGPTDIWDHANVFSMPQMEGYPREVYLTDQSEYGFWLISSGVAYTTLGNMDGTVYFTEPGCNGQAHDWIGHLPADGAPVPAQDCTDAGIDALIAADQIVMHYWTEAAFTSWMDLRWPGALGQVITTPTFSHFYYLPAVQEWPEMLTSVSMRTKDGECIEFLDPVDGCSIRLLDTILQLDNPPGPYSLAEIPD